MRTQLSGLMMGSLVAIVLVLAVGQDVRGAARLDPNPHDAERAEASVSPDVSASPTPDATPTPDPTPTPSATPAPTPT